MIDVSILPAFALAVFLICIAPGPDMAFVVASGIGGGPGSGLMAAFGMATGMVVHTLLATLGLAALLEAAPASLTVVRVVGAIYLGYLAIVTIRSASTAGLQRSGPAAGTVFRRGVVTNLTNAKIILFFAAFLPQFISREHGAVAIQFALLGGLFLLVGLVVDAGVGLAAGSVRAALTRRPSWVVGLNVVSGLTYASIAAALVVSAMVL